MNSQTAPGNTDTVSQTAEDELPSYSSVVGEAARATTSDEKTATPPSPPGDRAEPAACTASKATPASPPSYARQDPGAKTYLLRPPLIYARRALGVGTSPSSPPSSSNSSSSRSPELPVYHLWPLHPHALVLAPLTPADARRLARPSSSASSSASWSSGSGAAYTVDALGRRVRTVAIDEDTALYQCSRVGGSVEIQGRKTGPTRTVPGLLVFEPGGGVVSTGSFWGLGAGDGGGGRFWQRRRRRLSEAERREGERRMARRGYRPEEEWERSVLFEVVRRRGPASVLGLGDGTGRPWAGARSGFEWRNAEGRVLANEGVDEEGVHKLDLVEVGVDLPGGGTAGPKVSRAQVMREALITCWVGRLWALGSISVDL